MTVYCTLNDSKLPWPKVGLLEYSNEGMETQCLICEKPLKVHKDKLYEIIDVFCSLECLNKEYKIPEITESNTSTTKNQHSPCKNCGGPAKGRGYIHKDDCSELPEIKTKRKCSECSGKARGRGFIHVGNCSKKMGGIKEEKPKRLCPKCNGPARGKGFIHKENCKE